MRLTEAQIRKVIRQEHIRLILEDAAKSAKDIPSKESVSKVSDSIQKGAEEARGTFTPKHVLAAMKASAKKAGYADPCEFAKMEHGVIVKDIEDLERAKKTLRSESDPVKGLENVSKAIMGLGAGSLAMTLLSGTKYLTGLTAALPQLGAAAATAGQAGTQAAMLAQMGMTGAAKAKVAAAGAAAATKASAVQASAMAGSSVMGLTVSAWITVGGILVALALAIWLYKWMIKTGNACKLKEFIKGVGKATAEGIKNAYTNTVAPLIDKISSWGSDLVKKVKSMFSKKKNESLSRPSFERREADRAIRQWNRLNEVAMIMCLDIAESGL